MPKQIQVAPKHPGQILYIPHVESRASTTGARVNTIVSPPGGFFTNAEIEQVSIDYWYYCSNHLFWLINIPIL